MDIKMNHLQSPLNDEVRKSVPKEVWDNVLEYIAQVTFIQRLISPDRDYIKDKPIMQYTDENDVKYDDPEGRRVIDLVNPHILENMDYFRERAIFFDANGKYTNLIPNPNPKSEFAQFWKEEVRRWKHGQTRPDGEWIPGELYFYWNYSPIWLVEEVKGKGSKKGKTRGERVKNFPKPWLGDYLFHHYINAAKDNGQHGKLLKTRGVGFSFKAGAWGSRNMFVYPGTGNPNFYLASDKTFLSGDKGIWGKVLDTLDWIGHNTPLPRMRLVDGKKAMEIQLGYEDEYGARKGLLSSAFGISMKDNPDKARGIRGPLIDYEEDGLFPNLEAAWNINRKAVEDGDVAFGFMLAGGTGGTQGASFEGSEKLFYQPGAYNIYGLPNVFDRNTNGDTECGYFWGAYMNRNKCYELDNGEPDVIKALIEICLDRYNVKYSASDAKAITQKKAEEPITPQEAVMRTEGTLFPVADLKQYLEDIGPKKESFLAEHYVGDLAYLPNGELVWKPNSNIFPIRSYTSTDGNRHGALEIFEMPKKNGNNEIVRGRYIAGIDPIDSDTGNSLFSIFVMDTFTDRIVAEYSGRPRTSNEAYEIALRTLKLYNAEANYESNLKGLFNYFDKYNALHYLADAPQILKDMEMSKQTNLYGNRAKGTHANAKINTWGRQLQADWMLSPVYNPDDEKDTRLNLHRIRSLGYLEECIYWNSDGNFDRVSAAGMLFILREERFKRSKSAKENQHKQVNKMANDPFFSKNYKTTVNTYKAMSQ